MELILGIIAAVAVVSAGMVAVGRSGAKTEQTKRMAAAGLTLEQAATLKSANKDIHDATNIAYRIRNVELRDASKETLAKANKLVDAMKQQPAEIRRANQFFTYYVPTMKVVLGKYLTLEDSGKSTPELVEHTMDYLADTSKAYDLQFDNFFKDEVLDLTVEVEAMQMALKRDGLS